MNKTVECPDCHHIGIPVQKMYCTLCENCRVVLSENPPIVFNVVEVEADG